MVRVVVIDRLKSLLLAAYFWTDMHFINEDHYFVSWVDKNEYIVLVDLFT